MSPCAYPEAAPRGLRSLNWSTIRRLSFSGSRNLGVMKQITSCAKAQNEPQILQASGCLIVPIRESCENTPSYINGLTNRDIDKLSSSNSLCNLATKIK